MSKDLERRSDSEGTIELHGVTRIFRRANGEQVSAVTEVDLRIEGGDFVCIVGPSGQGKTTLLHMLAGLVAPTAGEIVVGGQKVVGPGPDRGVVFQRDSVFPWMRVIDNVEYGLRCRGVDRTHRRATARSFLEAVGLAGVERSWPRELSGGMLKRVAVATVFANGAQVLLLDEPFGALDYVTKRQLHNVLLKLWTGAEVEVGFRRTVVFVTHDVDEALMLADRVVVLRHGKIVEDLSPVSRRPRTDDDLAGPDMLAQKHLLLRHLGLETAAGSEPKDIEAGG